MKVLYVEDEQTIAQPVVKFLERKGFQVDFLADGKNGLSSAITNNYDCIILDLNLPEVDGLTIAREIRSRKITTPILMLTARTALDDKLDGFDSGTDDYLTKPFELLELVARLNALIKRSSENKEEELMVGDYVIKVDQNLLLNAETNEIQTLSTKEMGVLEYLIRHAGRVVSTEELLEHVWDTNINLFTDTVKTHIKTLRRKLGTYAANVKTIKGKGYVYQR